MEQYTGLYTGEGDEGMKEVREREEKGGRGEGREGRKKEKERRNGDGKRRMLFYSLVSTKSCWYLYK